MKKASAVTLLILIGILTCCLGAFGCSALRAFFRYRVVFCFAVTYRAYHRGCIRFQAF